MKIDELTRRLEEDLAEILEPEGMEELRATVSVNGYTLDGEWKPQVGDEIVISFKPSVRSQPTPPDIVDPYGFRPISIRGEPLSATIIRDRGER